MLQLVVFVLVLAAVYAVKAWSISRSYDELVEDSTSFSWMRADSLENLELPVQETEQTAVSTSRVAGHTLQGARA